MPGAAVARPLLLLGVYLGLLGLWSRGPLVSTLPELAQGVSFAQLQPLRAETLSWAAYFQGSMPPCSSRPGPWTGDPMRIHYEAKPFHQLTPQELHDVFRLRTEVFVVEQNCAYQDVDGLDPVALHLLGRTPDGALESYARLLPVGASYPEHAAIGRVITSGRIRGTGEGSRLMEVSIQEAERAFGGAVPIKLGAQDYALDFYRRLGFEPAGEGYMEDGIPHTPMELKRPAEFRRRPVPPGASSG